MSDTSAGPLGMQASFLFSCIQNQIVQCESLEGRQMLFNKYLPITYDYTFI